MRHAANFFRASVLFAGLFAATIAASSAPAAACPPSEGEFDFEFYDISGDGMVQLPAGVKVTAVAKTSTTDKEGKIVVDKRVALVVEDPTNKNARVLTMHLPPMAAMEIKEWLASAVESQEAWLKESKAIERPGIECVLDSKRCRELGKDKKATVPAMYVSVASKQGRHGWSMLSEPASRTPGTCSEKTGRSSPAPAVAVQEDHRISITTYDRSDRGRPLTMKMDAPTAKNLLADLSRAIDERDGKILPAVEVEKSNDAKSAS